MIEFKLHRGDLIKDKLGNYYFVASQAQKKLILVNAIIYFSYGRILNEEYLKEHKGEYVGQYPRKQLVNHIERIQDGKVQSKIYLLETLLNDGYEIVVEGLYHQEPQIKVEN